MLLHVAWDPSFLQTQQQLKHEPWRVDTHNFMVHTISEHTIQSQMLTNEKEIYCFMFRVPMDLKGTTADAVNWSGKTSLSATKA